ncbi:sigma-54 dependent transcriptional regulator [Chryseobacterium sp. SSA4.19]|uniref:sigma-54 interaction domain-containing protein n=1 Tax=Chryseobacterium sp. SSA4.19 TaxID=2919915 RepID=UPI001F4D7E9B|nr:sigma-54 dependent transcriptional regulator [Chryseobacterium sp. SSA4.19]MCJ8153020.1 sigma-54 dependent transcriptional regulator [Chryseobacterium sp. SSA4.19]
MSKQADHTAEIMNRLHSMQREQLLISSLHKEFAGVLDKQQFQKTLNQGFKSQFLFDDIVILNKSADKIRIFLSSSVPQSDSFSNTHDIYFEQCLNSAEPILFDLKELPVNKSSTPMYFINAKDTGMRIAAGFSLPMIQDKQNVLFLFYKNHISADAIPERILTAISTQLSVTIRNIMIGEQLDITRDTIREAEQEIIPQKIELKGFQGIIGESEVMKNIFDQIAQVAPSESNVIIYGETGTGKELIAQAVHNLSVSSRHRMVRINCASIPANLIESELFGYDKGSFTGASEQRRGKFEQAENGTIFLDEIGELPLELQGRLLRVLQEKEIERIGGNKRIKVNARVIAATNRNLEQEVAKGNFRSDLFYRLNVFPIHLPALRDRKEDIPLLADYFLEKHNAKTGKKIKGFSRKIIHKLCEHHWQGNIRELENIIERNIITAKENVIKEIDLPQTAGPQQTGTSFEIKTLQQVEKEYILKVIEKCNGKISGPSGAARLLGLPPTTLISKMQKLGIEKRHYFKNPK